MDPSHHSHQGEGDFAIDIDPIHDRDLQLGCTPMKPEPNPELDNFLGRVDEITAVISSLASKDPSENERGMRQANLLLHERKDGFGDGESITCQVKHDRSVINKVKDDPLTSAKCQDEMSTQAFMRAMEKDSDDRAANRKERKVVSDKFRKAGNIKFGQKNFAAALKNYNEAIKLIKDSPCLYNNRALTYIRLGIFSSAVEDCEKALFLEEFSLRARMFLAKAHFLMGNADKCREALDDARKKLLGSVDLINDYERDLFNMSTEKSFDFDLDTERKWQAAARYEGTEFPGKASKKESKLEKKMSNSNLEQGPPPDPAPIPEGAGDGDVIPTPTEKIALPNKKPIQEMGSGESSGAIMQSDLENEIVQV